MLDSFGAAASPAKRLSCRFVAKQHNYSFRMFEILTSIGLALVTIAILGQAPGNEYAIIRMLEQGSLARFSVVGGESRRPASMDVFKASRQASHRTRKYLLLVEIILFMIFKITARGGASRNFQNLKD